MGDSYAELLCPYLDGELSPPEARDLEAHLQDCEACRLELDGLRSLIGELGALPQLEAPPALLERVRDGLAAAAAAPATARPVARPAAGGWGRQLRRAMALAAGILLAVWISSVDPAPPGPQEQAAGNTAGEEELKEGLSEDELENADADEEEARTGSETERALEPPRDGMRPDTPAPEPEADEVDPSVAPRGIGAPPPAEAVATPDEGGGGGASVAADVEQETGGDEQRRKLERNLGVLLAELADLSEVQQDLDADRSNSLLAEVPEERMPELLGKLEQLPGVELDLKDLGSRRARLTKSDPGGATSGAETGSAWLFDEARRDEDDAGDAGPAGSEPKAFGGTPDSVSLELVSERLFADTVAVDEVRWLLRLLEIPSLDERRQILFLLEPVDPAVGALEREAATRYLEERARMLESADD